MTPPQRRTTGQSEQPSGNECWWPCCDHCGCGTPDGMWLTREGHDDTCEEGCNDD